MATRGSGAPGDGERRRIAALGLLALALVVALAAGSGGGAARFAQDGPLDPGGAQVVAQGVAPLPEGEAVWRVAYHPLEPGDGDAPDPRPLGFLLADAGEVLLTEEPGARQTLLAPGEAAFGRAGEQRRAPAGDDPAAYFALELVPSGTDGGDGRPVFLGPSFAPPPGARDLNLLRALLAPGRESVIRAGAAPTLVLATDGAVRVESSDGASAPLRAGEAAVFAGDLTITAEEDAVVAAAVVGSGVSREGAVGTPVASPAASPAASPVASPVAGGAIAVTLHGCPSDLGPGEFAPETCYEDETAVELALAGGGGVGGGDLIAPIAGGNGDGPPVWTGLPFGEYELRAVGFPPGYDRFFVPGLPGSGSGSGSGAELAGDPGAGYGEGGGGYRVRLAPETPIYRLDAYAFASAAGAATPTPAARQPTPRPAATPPAEETGSIAVRVFVCPGASLQSFDPAGCALVNNGFETRLEGEGLEDALTRDDSDAGAGGSRVWDGLPFGTYAFSQPRLPTGAAIYYVPESDAVSLLPDNSGYAVVLNEDAPEVALDVYNIAPLSLPAPAAQPAPVPPPAAVPLPTPAPLPTLAPPPPAPVPTPFPAPTPVPAAPAPAPVEPTPPSAPTAPPVAPPAPTVPAVVDADGDSLTDDVEAGTYGTDPGVFDTDGDGVGDGAEIAAGTDPFAPAAPVPTAAPAVPPPAATDSDGDGLADADEATYGANPAAPDTDGDGFADGAEVAAGSNPANSSSNPQGGG